MNNGIKIESLTSLQALEHCATLLIEAYNFPPWNDSWTPETAKALLNCYYNSPEFIGWFATAGSDVVVFAVGNVEPHYNGSIFYVRDIVVSSPFQKLGLGKELMARIKKDLSEQGIKTIILFTNKAIVGFYEKSGFATIEDMNMMICKE